jgi:hypothetical protein
MAKGFLTVDPAREFINPYSYVGNNPIVSVDPDGRLEIETVDPVRGMGPNGIRTERMHLISFQTSWYEHGRQSSGAQALKDYAPSPGKAFDIVSEAIESVGILLSGTVYLDYSQISGIEGKSEIRGWVDQAAFETRVAANFKKLFPDKPKYASGFGRTTYRFDAEGGEGLQMASAAFIMTLLEMESSNDLPKGSGQKIFDALGLDRLVESADESADFYNSLKTLIFDKIEGQATDAVINTVRDAVVK